MITFNSNIKEFLQTIVDKNDDNVIKNKIIDYLLKDNITGWGFYSTLENNGILNIQSLKRVFINLLLEIKNEMINSQLYLTNKHFDDLDILKKIFQINDSELLYYKNDEIKEIINKQMLYCINTKKINQSETTIYLNRLKQVLGLPHTEYFNSISNISLLSTEV